MEPIGHKARVFGMVFLLANRLQLLGDQMDPGMTTKQWLLVAGVLRCGNEAPALSEVAAQIGSSRQNVKKMAVILARRGFVAMERDRDDARVVRIRLTEACLAHLRQRDGIERRFLEALFAGCAPGELAALSGGMEKLLKNLAEMGNGDAEA
ncbi:MAG: MarR family transcriptional regulator [Clostridiales bacterium]|nr:MarR family transcriptional regulator [Clostridiales bacterium]